MNNTSSLPALAFAFLSIIYFIFRPEPVSAQATLLPLVNIDTLQYQGAFIIPAGSLGTSLSDYCAGTIEYNPANHSLFLAGKKEDGSIGEFGIPAPVIDTNLTSLNTATVIQNFSNVLNRTATNPQGMDRISGLKLHDGKLIVNAVEYYDAPADNTHTTMVLDDPTDLAASMASGYYELDGEAHIAGWISDVPSEWQSLLGGSHIAGNSSRYPIVSRLSVGPAAFIFDPFLLTGTPSGVVSTTPLLDFSLANPLYAAYDSIYDNAYYNLISVLGSTPSGHTFADAMATVGTNDLWTAESQASFGFILPNTRTYLTIGSSGGHTSGIGYKPTQDNGNLCGGPCAYVHDDYYNYYWLWDVNDLLDVKNGIQQAYDIRPYSYGVFDAPLQTDYWLGGTPEHHPITGGTYDPYSGQLYLTIYDGGATGEYSRNPAIAVYNVNTLTNRNSRNSEPIQFSIGPNPTKDHFSIYINSRTFDKAIISSLSGQELMESNSQKMNIEKLPKGVYFVRVVFRNGESVMKKIVTN